jgi:hypothetical protein
MSKAYAVYVLMFAAAIGGLWVVLTLGKAAKAPDDLSGEWTVTWNGTPPAEMKEAPMRVSQSGRYFLVRFGSRPGMSFTLQPGWHGARDGRQLQMKLDGDGWKMYLHGDIPLGERPMVGEMHVVLSGPGDVAGVARRVGFEPTTRAAGMAHAR